MENLIHSYGIATTLLILGVFLMLVMVIASGVSFLIRQLTTRYRTSGEVITLFKVVNLNHIPAQESISASPVLAGNGSGITLNNTYAPAKYNLTLSCREFQLLVNHEDLFHAVKLGEEFPLTYRIVYKFSIFSPKTIKFERHEPIRAVVNHQTFEF